MEGQVRMVASEAGFETFVTSGFQSYQEFEGAGGAGAACVDFADGT